MIDGGGSLGPHDAIRAVLDGEGTALAVIAGVEGPSYRPLGAMMAIDRDGRRTGALSSGCIEADIARHADLARECGRPRLLRYGLGSPFVDMALPCGGGLDVLVLPRPDRSVLEAVARSRLRRRTATLAFDCDSGAMTLGAEGRTRREGDALTVRIEPDLRFIVLGKGPEAATFAALAASVACPTLLLSPDPETLEAVASGTCETRLLAQRTFPRDLAVDGRTAIVLFFHDHDREPPLLAGALATPAIYVGAQGSRRADAARREALRAMGVGEAALARLRGPIGLVPSARDPRTLAVSVLAEVMAEAMQGAG